MFFPLHVSLVSSPCMHSTDTAHGKLNAMFYNPASAPHSLGVRGNLGCHSSICRAQVSAPGPKWHKDVLKASRNLPEKSSEPPGHNKNKEKCELNVRHVHPCWYLPSGQLTRFPPRMPNTEATDWAPLRHLGSVPWHFKRYTGIPCLVLFFRHHISYKLKVCGDTAWTKSLGAIFLAAFAPFCLCVTFW